jgi:hypothetical protein
VPVIETRADVRSEEFRNYRERLLALVDALRALERSAGEAEFALELRARRRDPARAARGRQGRKVANRGGRRDLRGRLGDARGSGAPAAPRALRAAGAPVAGDRDRARAPARTASSSRRSRAARGRRGERSRRRRRRGGGWAWRRTAPPRPGRVRPTACRERAVLSEGAGGTPRVGGGPRPSTRRSPQGMPLRRLRRSRRATPTSSPHLCSPRGWPGGSTAQAGSSR